MSKRKTIYDVLAWSFWLSVIAGPIGLVVWLQYLAYGLG